MDLNAIADRQKEEAEKIVREIGEKFGKQTAELISSIADVASLSSNGMPLPPSVLTGLMQAAHEVMQIPGPEFVRLVEQLISVRLIVIDARQDAKPPTVN